MFTAIRPLEIITSTLLSEFIVREDEAPAEPRRRQLGRSLVLPLVFNRADVEKMFIGMGLPFVKASKLTHSTACSLARSAHSQHLTKDSEARRVSE